MGKTDVLAKENTNNELCGNVWPCSHNVTRRGEEEDQTAGKGMLHDMQMIATDLNMTESASWENGGKVFSVNSRLQVVTLALGWLQKCLNEC